MPVPRLPVQVTTVESYGVPRTTSSLAFVLVNETTGEVRTADDEPSMPEDVWVEYQDGGGGGAGDEGPTRLHPQWQPTPVQKHCGKRYLICAATGNVACVLHANVGLLHGMMGLFNAWCDRAPMLVLGATGPLASEKRRPWIDWIHTMRDQASLLRSFVKWDDQPSSPDALVESLTRANLLTRSHPTAPVYVCLDAGLQEEKLAREPQWPDLVRFQPPAPPRREWTG